MKKQIRLLIRLQQEDLTLERLRRRVLEGPQQIKGFDREIAALEEDVEADKRRVEEAKKTQRQHEAEVEDGVEQIRKSKTRLMSIKTNKEYQALLKEIENIKGVNGAREDKVLECMEEIENIGEILKIKQRDLSATRIRLDNEKKAVEADIRDAEEQIAESEEHRQEMVSVLDPKLLTRYEQIMAMSGGTAVVMADNATCGECHMNIPPQMYNELHKGDSLKFCPHCDRIIYWKGFLDAN